MYQIFWFFNISKTEGDIVNLDDMVNVELYNDNLKIFNQACEETLLALVMIWMKVSSRIGTKGNWESLHSL